MLAKRPKPEKIYVEVSGNGSIEINRLFDERRKALRNWLRRWGKKLKDGGYRVIVNQNPVLTLVTCHPSAKSSVLDRHEIVEPVFDIADPLPAETAEPDEVSVFLEEEKSKKVFDPKRARSKRLRQREEVNHPTFAVLAL